MLPAFFVSQIRLAIPCGHDTANLHSPTFFTG
jgi:hypothetical protein